MLRPSARTCALVATCLTAALALLLLDSKSFWLDEAMSVSYAAPGNSLTRVMLQDGGNMAFYYLLLHEWLRLGSSDWFVRLLSVVPAVLSVPLLFMLGRAVVGTPGAVLASFVLAMNVFFITYAQQARGYSLVLLASVASMLFFIRLRERKSLSDLLGYIVASVLMVATHVFGVFVLAAQVLSLLISDRGRMPWGLLGIATATIAAALLLVARVAHRTGLQHIQWVPPPSLHTTGAALAALAGSATLAVCYVLLAVYANISTGEEPHSKHRNAAVPPLALTNLWLATPIVGALAFSKFVWPIFVDRYLIVSLPALALLVGLGLALIRPLFLKAAVCMVLVFLNGLALSHYYAMGSLQDWRGAAGFIAPRAAAHDAVICYPPYMRAPLQHAIERLGTSAPELEYVKVPFYPERAAAPRSTAVASFASELERSSRVWFITASDGAFAPSFERRAQDQTAVILSLLGRWGKKVAMHGSFTRVSARLYVAPVSRSTGRP